jgi:MarR family transcriptional regulator, transcriptional regulator for hemolysin
MEKDQKLDAVLFFVIEKVHKAARRHSQEEFYKAGYDITLDQWLVLKKIHDVDKINQVELAEALFKDKASITRILSLLLKKKLIKKTEDSDKRAFNLSLTPAGSQFYADLLIIVNKLRKQYTESISVAEQAELKRLLTKIMDNIR